MFLLTLCQHKTIHTDETDHDMQFTTARKLTHKACVAVPFLLWNAQETGTLMRGLFVPLHYPEGHIYTPEFLGEDTVVLPAHSHTEVLLLSGHQ